MLAASSIRKVGTPFWHSTHSTAEVGGYQDGRGRRVGPPLSSPLFADSPLPWWAVGSRTHSSSNLAALKKRQRVECAVANKRLRVDCDALTQPRPAMASVPPTGAGPVLPLRLVWRHGQWRCPSAVGGADSARRCATPLRSPQGMRLSPALRATAVACPLLAALTSATSVLSSDGDAEEGAAAGQQQSQQQQWRRRRPRGGEGADCKVSTHAHGTSTTWTAVVAENPSRT